MKILVITNYYKPAYTYGGPIRSISALYEALAYLDIQVTVFTTNANGDKRLDVPLEQPVEVDGVEVFYFPLLAESTLLGRFHLSPRLGKACQRQIRDFDIVSLQDIWTYPMWSAAKYCKRNKIPYVVTPRGTLMPGAIRKGQFKKQVYLTLFARTLLNQAAAIHCTDPMELSAISTFNFKAPMFVVPNSVDHSKYETMPPRGMLRERFGISDEASILLMLGRIHEKKSPDIAVKALAAAQSLPQNVHLVVAGPDERDMKSGLQSLAVELGCENYLHFTGLLDSDGVLKALSDADLLLMPSIPYSENFGMSAAEALASGVPILVTEGMPVGVWAEKGGAGRISSHAPTAFAQAVCDLLAEPEQLSAMAKRGPEVVKQNFEISVVARQVITEYQTILSGNHRSAN